MSNFPQSNEVQSLKMFVLQIGLTYKIEVFVAERFPCYSEFLYQESNMTFVSEEEQRTSNPSIDYIANLNEDLHVNAIVQGIVLADAFSVGKFGISTSHTWSRKNSFLCLLYYQIIKRALREIIFFRCIAALTFRTLREMNFVYIYIFFNIICLLSYLVFTSLVRVYIAGPYSVTINYGNSQGRFEVKANDSAARTVAATIPASPTPTTTLLNGETIILCVNATSNITAIPNLISGPESFGTFTTSSVLMTLKNQLDYEVTKEYLIHLTVSDTSAGVSGNVSIKVSSYYC